MTITKTFEKVATQENAVFKQVDNKYKGDRGSFIHTSTYTLECNYRNVKIALKNELGHQNIGLISCQLDVQPDNCEFSIEALNTFFQLFNPKKNILQIAGDNSQLKNFIELNDSFAELNKRAKKDRFEPVITGENDNGKYVISCKYHLVFNNKELVVSPFFKFYKSLIDFFLDHRMRYN